MAVTIKYFGVIAEAAGLTEELVELRDVGNRLEDIEASILKKYKAIGDLSFQLAVNQTLTSSDTIKDGDEVAFLPPFAGG